MSQIIKNLASGPVPPSVATSYVTNSGTAIPSGNVLNVLGSGNSTTTGSGNTITIVTSGLTWTDEATSFNAVPGNGYFVSATATTTLPASPAQGNTISFIFDGASGALTIKANTGQIIRNAGNVSSTAGTAVSNTQGDSNTLVYRVSDSSWISSSGNGTWTLS